MIEDEIAKKLDKLLDRLDALIELWANFVSRRQDEQDARLEDKYVKAIESGVNKIANSLNGNGNGGGWNGVNRRSNESQEEWLAKYLDDRDDKKLGKSTHGFILWILGSFGAGVFATLTAVVIALLTGHWK